MVYELLQMQVRGKVQDMFREAAFRGISQADISRRLGLGKSALNNWANGNTDIDLWRFVKLCTVLPDEITSQAFAPIAKAVTSMQTGSGCFDEVGALATSYSAEYIKARSDDSPGASAIVHCEKPSLIKLVKKLRPACERVLVTHGACVA